MSIAFRAAASAAGNNVATLTINKPTGVVAGDVLVAIVTVNNTGGITSSGWTVVQTEDSGSNSCVALVKVAGGSEPTSYTFSYTGTTAKDWLGHIAAYSGVDNTTPVDVSGKLATTSSQATFDVPTPSVTTTMETRLVLGHGVPSSGSTLSTASGAQPTTSRGYLSGQTGINGALRLSDAHQIEAGSTGQYIATVSNNSVSNTTASGLVVTLRVGNNPPNAPILTAPADGATIDRNILQRFDWDFSDPDAGDSQSKAELRHRPTGVAKNEIQDVTISGAPTGGSFTLTFDGQTTGAIAYNATAADVQSALEALSNIGVGDVAVTGNAGGPYTVTFQGVLGATDVPQLTATSSLTGGTSPSVTVTTTQEGVPYPSWTTVAINSPNTYWDMASGTVLDGDYEWQVRTWDAQGLEGPWSSSDFFTAATPTGIPTITDPISGGTVDSDPYTVAWSTAEGQDAYQLRRVADNAGAADETTIYYDTGQVNSATARSASVPFETNDRYEHIQLRVYLAGLWSAWASIRVLVSYTPPMAPTFTVDLDSASGSLLVDITNPEPTAGEPSVSYNDISIDDGTGFERRATFLATNSSWRYWTPISGRDYSGSIKVTAVATNGTSTSTTSPSAVTDGGTPAATFDETIDGGTP
jgi:hypothetical protein